MCINKKITSMKKQIKNSKEVCQNCRDGYKLCSDEDCKLCFERSFASNPISEYWSESNEVSPRSVCKSSNAKYDILP